MAVDQPNLRQERCAVKQLYQAFPGDSGLEYDALWRTKRSYHVMGTYVMGAARGSGIALCPHTAERLFRIGAYAYLLDQLIDDQPADLPEQRDEARRIFVRLIRGDVLHVDEVPSWVNPDLIRVALLFNSATDEIDRTVINRLAMEILAIAPVKAAEQNVWRYAATVAREGRAMAGMMTACVSDQEHQARGYKALRTWFGHLGAGGALFDSACDLGADYVTKRTTSVKPTRMNRLALLVYCLATMTKLVLHPRIFGTMFVSFMKFWGSPLRLHKSWGQPALEWRRTAIEAYKLVDA